jgi:hypothetical protein
MSATMPHFSNLKSVSAYAGIFADVFDSPSVSKLLSGHLQKLSFTSETPPNSSVQFELLNTPIINATWLNVLHRDCDALRVLAFDFHLAPTARTALQLLLLSATLKELFIGHLLDEVVDDWTIAIALAQPLLRILDLSSPITPDSLQILRDQCEGHLMLSKLQKITAVSGINAEQALADLLSYTPNLTSLNIIIDHPVNATAWSPSATAFRAIGQLMHLRVLQLRIVTVLTRDIPGRRLFTSITGADLLTLFRLLLSSLSIKPHYGGSRYLLELREITPADLIHILRRWQLLDFLRLDLLCKELIGNSSQEDCIYEVLSVMDVGLDVGFFWYDDNHIDADVWLGHNSNFCPDPLAWKLRQLHQARLEGNVECLAEEQEEDELLVWLTEPEFEEDEVESSGANSGDCCNDEDH